MGPESASRLTVVQLMLIVMTIWLGRIPRAVEALQFGLTHSFAHLEGSSAKSGDKGMSPDHYEMLKAHDRKRLAAVLEFPLKGDSNVYITGTYYTQITLGTPPLPYNVIVDTGSIVMWLNCAPCLSCPARSVLQGVTLRQYDPLLSSTDTVLACASSACLVASNGSPTCTDSGPTSGACSYSVSYGDGSSTEGYLINDMMTFNQVENSTNSNGTANVYFGCGYNQTGNLQSESTALDGLMGFGLAAISVPSQLAAQNKAGRVFAHCLKGDDLGGGILVIGNILEPDIAYRPLVTGRTTLYEVGLQNIAVNGMNITAPASFDSTVSSGAIMDSGTSLAILVQTIHDPFVAAVCLDHCDFLLVRGVSRNWKQLPGSNAILSWQISINAPVPSQQIKIDGFRDPVTCFLSSDSIIETFPEVTLFFDGGAVMNLGPLNYLFLAQLPSGGTAYCIGWSLSTDLTLFGDIVLKDQLVVYDNDKNRLGWRAFDRTKPIAVGT